MRIITGSAKGTKLISADYKTKPLSDRAKGAIFSILQEKIPGSSVLDVYAGSGALGLEAISRGARHAVFIDISQKAVEGILANIQKCHMEEQADVLRMDAIKYLKKFRDEQFDIIFVCPPYGDVKYHAVKSAVPLVAPNGILVFEHHKKDQFHPLEDIEKIDERVYGIVKFEIYRKG